MVAMKKCKVFLSAFCLLGTVNGMAAAGSRHNGSSASVIQREQLDRSIGVTEEPILAYHTLKVTFPHGQSGVSAKTQRQLREFVSQAKQRGDVQEVYMAVWSDKSYPASAGYELTRGDRSLASTRIKHIEKSLDNLDAGSVKSFNMADKTDTLASVLGTDDAELKSLFAKEGSPSARPVEEEGLNLIKQNAGASSAVLVAKIKTGTLVIDRNRMRD